MHMRAYAELHDARHRILEMARVNNGVLVYTTASANTRSPDKAPATSFPACIAPVYSILAPFCERQYVTPRVRER